ncbi:hypothetical protein C0J52_07370 [Blattella germanica]|nr:hypothetical protein C0J52_07370 [Blattella germanica]
MREVLEFATSTVALKLENLENYPHSGQPRCATTPEIITQNCIRGSPTKRLIFLRCTANTFSPQILCGCVSRRSFHLKFNTVSKSHLHSEILVRHLRDLLQINSCCYMDEQFFMQWFQGVRLLGDGGYSLYYSNFGKNICVRNSLNAQNVHIPFSLLCTTFSISLIAMHLERRFTHSTIRNLRVSHAMHVGCIQANPKIFGSPLVLPRNLMFTIILFEKQYSYYNRLGGHMARYFDCTSNKFDFHHTFSALRYTITNNVFTYVIMRFQ